MKVAVPSPQHSPMFGQLPLSQIVWSLWVSTSDLTLRYPSPMGSLTLNQSGFLSRLSGSCLSFVSMGAVISGFTPGDGNGSLPPSE
jgi:hypothetical protein